MLRAHQAQVLLAAGNPDLAEYARLMEQKIAPEMKIANTYSNLLTMFPGRLFNMVRGEERVWRGACRLLRGERPTVLIEADGTARTLSIDSLIKP